MSWRVWIGGRDTGIVETDYEWALRYWQRWAQRRGAGRVELRAQA